MNKVFFNKLRLVINIGIISLFIISGIFPLFTNSIEAKPYIQLKIVGKGEGFAVEDYSEVGMADYILIDYNLQGTRKFFKDKGYLTYKGRVSFVVEYYYQGEMINKFVLRGKTNYISGASSHNDGFYCEIEGSGVLVDNNEKIDVEIFLEVIDGYITPGDDAIYFTMTDAYDNPILALHHKSYEVEEISMSNLD